MSTKTKKMTIAYWNGLSQGSKKRALQYVFPILPATVEMLLNEKPTKVNDRGSLWWIVFREVRIPCDCWYKTVVHKTFLM